MKESDVELNNADREDFTSEDEESDLSTGSGDESCDDDLNFNTSFTGGYQPDTDLTKVEKGGNP
jgi:hypothetical protein